MTRISVVRWYFPLINLVLVAGLVVVGIFQVKIYWRQANIMDTQADIAGKQWIAMKEQLGEMKGASQDTKDAIAGIRQLADATINSSNKAEAFYISSLRAWVAYDGPPMPVTPLFISKTSARFDMRFHIQNVGKSVASSVKLLAELHILADYQSWQKNNSICDRARADSVEVSIIPNTTFFTDRKVAVTSDAEWDEYQNMVRREAGVR